VCLWENKFWNFKQEKKKITQRELEVEKRENQISNDNEFLQQREKLLKAKEMELEKQETLFKLAQRTGASDMAYY